MALPTLPYCNYNCGVGSHKKNNESTVCHNVLTCQLFVLYKNLMMD